MCPRVSLIPDIFVTIGIPLNKEVHHSYYPFTQLYSEMTYQHELISFLTIIYQNAANKHPKLLLLMKMNGKILDCF